MTRVILPLAGIFTFFLAESLSATTQIQRLTYPREERGYSIESRVGVDSSFSNFHLMLRADFFKKYGIVGEYQRNGSIQFYAPYSAFFDEGWAILLAPLGYARQTGSQNFFTMWGVQWVLGFLSFTGENFISFKDASIRTQLEIRYDFFETTYSRSFFLIGVSKSTSEQNFETYVATGMRF
jgi:hypothetical protein